MKNSLIDFSLFKKNAEINKYVSSVHFNLLATLAPTRCPPGYRVEKLQPHHSDLVHSKWGVAETSSKWIQQCIENLNSAALYREDDLSNPLAWILEYQTREIGYAYTSEFYRKNGYAALVGAALCKALVKDWPGVPPFATVTKDNSLLGLGFVRSGFVACCV